MDRFHARSAEVEVGGEFRRLRELGVVRRHQRVLRDRLPHAGSLTGGDRRSHQAKYSRRRQMTRVVDVSNSASFEDVAVMKFFEASTRNLLAQEAAAGVRHHVALSVVGTERLSESGKYHGEGKPDGGRMTNEGVKAFFPEREQRAAPMISAVRFPNKPV